MFVGPCSNWSLFLVITCIILFLCNTGNQGLCGKPVSNPCNKTPNKSEVPPNPASSHKEKAKKHQIFIPVIVVVSVVILASVAALHFLHSHRRKSRDPLLGHQLNSQDSGGFKEAVSIDLTHDFKNGGDQGELNFVREEKGCFDLQDLLRASAEVLGSGSFGSTYKAMVLNGPTVVVKRFRHMNKVWKQEFCEHMQKLGSLKHPNVLPLVAFYYRKEEKFLVYDYGENGSLASHLHGMP